MDTEQTAPKVIPMTSKLSFGTTVRDWQEGINVARLREERAVRARKIMRKHGIAALVASEPPSVRYLTGLRVAPLHQTTYVLFFADDHDPVVFAHAGWYQQMPEDAPWIKNWRVARAWFAGIAGPGATSDETKKFASEIHQELADRGLAKEKVATIAIDGLGQEALRKEGITVVEGWPMMMEMRTIKTQDEITCFRMVASMCGAAYQRLHEGLRPGITDIDANRIAINSLYDLGADAIWVATRSGPMSFERAFYSTGRIIEHGELLYVNMCRTQFLGYSACIYRTFVVGRQPTGKEVGMYNRLRDRLDSVMDAIRPGNTTADAAKHFPPAKTWGYKDEAEVFTVEFAHGIGLHELYDPPIVSRHCSFDHPQPFEPGMVLAVESMDGEHRVGGVRLENMVVVTEKGIEMLDSFPRDKILVAGTC